MIFLYGINFVSVLQWVDNFVPKIINSRLLSYNKSYTNIFELKTQNLKLRHKHVLSLKLKTLKWCYDMSNLVVT